MNGERGSLVHIVTRCRLGTTFFMFFVGCFESRGALLELSINFPEKIRCAIHRLAAALHDASLGRDGQRLSGRK